ncbi:MULTISPECIES: MATE family efflux transporter [unclassified Bacteroides]|uniref:MATE family efflux transporter n=1 Tax=unclassified Bacteroides TaxID=2646097 RepID=UPI0004E146E1|nr:MULTISPECIES: MATE family efflux transporter [unclassified Bacteroides]
MHKKILQIAVPAIISNITVPLLGLVDVVIVGHLGAASYIGAIAVGGMMFSLIYWIFAFLRMGTSGMTAQAWGRRDLGEVARLFVRSMAIAFAIGLILIALQKPIVGLVFRFISASDEVRLLACRYFGICIWGAPAALGLFSLSGWYIGVQNSRLPMWVAIIQNVVNIVVSTVLVIFFGMKIEGVAIGTLVAQYAALLLALGLCRKYYGRVVRRAEIMRSFGRGEMMRFFSVNGDIFLRMLCLVAVTVYFTSAGARNGDVVLAVNTLIMQFFTLFSYFMDGFAYAGEALCGKSKGSGDYPQFRATVRALFGWGVALAGIVSFVYLLGGEAFVGVMTDDASVVAESAHYIMWAGVIPVASFAAFLFDGIFIGITATKGMLVSMFTAMLCFFGVVTLCNDYNNHVLLFAFVLYLFVRGVIQYVIYKLYIIRKFI